MTTEYYLEEGDTHESVARDLLEQAEHPDQVHWSPRPDVHGGGVYLLADHGIAERTRQARQARRAEEAQQIADALAAAEERDSHPDVAEGLATPAEAGFPASLTPASEAEADAAAVADAEAADEAEEADAADAAAEQDGEAPATPKLTPAQKRAATKKAQQQAAADEAAADEEKSE